MYWHMKNLLEQIKQLPNGDNILRLFNEAKQALGNSTLTICDYNERGGDDVSKGYGRYEPEKGIIWIQMRHPDHVKEYILAHEIGHVMQGANGFPRVSIRDILRDWKEYNEHQELVHPDIVVRIHRLSDVISDLLLDPGADSFARANHLLSKDALLYMEERDIASICSIVLPAFDRERLCCGINEALDSIRGGTSPQSPQVMRALLETARFATVYAIRSLRYSQEDLFDCLDKKYKEDQLIIYALGRELLNIVGYYNLNTIIGCQKAAKHLIANLQLPSEAVGLRTFQEWLT